MTTTTYRKPNDFAALGTAELPVLPHVPSHFSGRPTRDNDPITQGRADGDSSYAPHVDYKPVLQPKIVTPEIRETFRALQKWEGFVTEVKEETFVARLTPTLGDDLNDQEAEIYIDEVADDDRVLLVPGAVFYWSIGYFERPSNRATMSIIRFRRLPRWTQRDADRIAKEAARLAELLNG